MQEQIVIVSKYDVLQYYLVHLCTIAFCSVCYNGGTCMSPEVCECVAGWTGNDCSRGTENITWL